MPMTNRDAEIAKTKKLANARIAKIKRAAAAEQRAIDEKVVELLREQDGFLYDRLAAEATDAFTKARELRSQRARREPVALAPAPTPGLTYDSYDASFQLSAS